MNEASSVIRIVLSVQGLRALLYGFGAVMLGLGVHRSGRGATWRARDAREADATRHPQEPALLQPA